MRKIHSLLIIAVLLTAMGAFTTPTQALSGALSFTPSSLNFGNQSVGTTSAALSVTVKNISGANLQLGKLTITGDFKFKASDCQWKLLAPNGTCTFSVVFTPLSATYKTGTVTVQNAISPTADTVALIGYGIGANLLKSATFDFPFSKPIPWKEGPLPITLPEVLDCSVSVSPLCSVKLNGSSAFIERTIYQAVARNGLIGDKYVFLLSSKAMDIPVGGKYKVEVVLMNMYNKIVGTKTINFATGTHDFQTVKGTIIAKAQFTWVIFRFTLQKTKGTAWFDNAVLIQLP